MADPEEPEEYPAGPFARSPEQEQRITDINMLDMSETFLSVNGGSIDPHQLGNGYPIRYYPFEYGGGPYLPTSPGTLFEFGGGVRRTKVPPRWRRRGPGRWLWRAWSWARYGSFPWRSWSRAGGFVATGASTLAVWDGLTGHYGLMSVMLVCVVVCALSVVSANYLAGRQRRWPIRCPQCGQEVCDHR